MLGAGVLCLVFPSSSSLLGWTAPALPLRMESAEGPQFGMASRLIARSSALASGAGEANAQKSSTQSSRSARERLLLWAALGGRVHGRQAADGRGGVVSEEMVGPLPQTLARGTLTSSRRSVRSGSRQVR